MSHIENHIAVRWEGGRATSADRECIIGRELCIKAHVLQNFSASLLTPVEQDLVVLAGAVAYADRVVRRQRSKGWSRSIRLSVPVNARAVWTKPGIVKSLTDTVEYVTGDHWSFDFLAGARALAIPQSSLDFTRGNYVVVPFSDGLDSFLQWQLMKKEEPDLNILRVHTSSRVSNRARNRRIDAAGDPRDQRLSLPLSISPRDHAEPTYRTRTFLFYAIAALAAHKVGSARVVIGENGVGALGPSMVPFGDEYPHRTTHPAFTQRLSAFLNLLLGAKLTFEHPQRYRTKGQVLERAIQLDVDGWRETHSCTRGSRDRLMGLPCGVCGGCLLRRSAVAAAKQDDGRYFWDDLSGTTLDACRSDAQGRESTKNDLDIALHGICDMSVLAELGDPSAPATTFERAAWEIVGSGGPIAASTAAKLAELARAHAIEWQAFRARFGATGFLNEQHEE